MNKEQQDFLEEFMINFATKYPKRDMEGVKKYDSVIHKDYTVKQHLENVEEELFDGLAYVYAIKKMVEESLDYCQQQNGLPYCKNCGLGR